VSQNQKSLEDEHSCKQYDDEFHIDLTLQKASSCSEDDSVVGTVSAAEVKQTTDDSAQGVMKPLPMTATDLQQQQEQTKPQPSQQQQEVQEVQQQPPPPPLHDIVDSPQDPTEKIPKPQVEIIAIELMLSFFLPCLRLTVHCWDSHIGPRWYRVYFWFCLPSVIEQF
jgi:hypothetical protein